MKDLAPIGHNGFDPIDEATAPFGDVIAEAQVWLDGSPIENDDQMKAVDDLIKGVKAALKAVDAARDAVTKPLHEVWKGEIARWKPTQDDLSAQIAGLVALVDPYKRKVAADKAEAARVAQALVWEAAEKARIAAHAADPTNIDAVRAAKQADADFAAAQKNAAAAAKDTVKGMRTYDVTEVLDGTAYARWLWQNDRAPLLAWMNEHAAKMRHNIADVVVTRQEKRAV